jgi:hypothetical protein
VKGKPHWFFPGDLLRLSLLLPLNPQMVNSSQKRASSSSLLFQIVDFPDFSQKCPTPPASVLLFTVHSFLLGENAAGWTMLLLMMMRAESGT